MYLSTPYNRVVALEPETGKTIWEYECPYTPAGRGVVPGLDAYPGNHPPVFPIFWSFRIMVGTGLLMLAVSWSAAFFLKRRHSLLDFGHSARSERARGIEHAKHRVVAGNHDQIVGTVNTLDGGYFRDMHGCTRTSQFLR